MGSSDESPFLLHCGVCATQLTDDTALFTSCGHFFCADPNSKCTRIKPENRTFPCEQCGQQCEAGVLSQRGTRYDQRVRSFVFSDLGKEMQTIAEILQFRNKHIHILSENASAQRKKIIALTENLRIEQRRIKTLTIECKQQMVESETLRTEKEKLEAIIAELRRKNDMLRTDRSRKTQQQKLPTRSSHPKPAAVDSLAMDRAKEMAVIDVDEPVLMTNVREESGRRTANTDIHTLRTLEPSVRTVEPSRRTLDESTRRRTMEKSNHSRSQATERYRSWGRTSAADGITSRVSKRRWADRVAGPDEGSLSVQKAKRVSNISRFAHGGGGNNSFAANSNRVQSFGGDWQRRVSTVPRPSATPDRMRRAGRRPARAVNPMASRL